MCFFVDILVFTTCFTALFFIMILKSVLKGKPKASSKGGVMWSLRDIESLMWSRDAIEKLKWKKTNKKTTNGKKK